jgi:putative membrane-bound dehydrogenase-like protein
VNFSLPRLAALLLVWLGGLILGLAASTARPKAKPAPFDFHQPAFPRKPAPKWLKIVDQGKLNPRLKGYKTPEGIKVEIVAEEPVVVNPVGMTFADDGTPYVLEWRPSPGDEWREKAVTFKYKDDSTREVVTMTKRVKDVVKTLALARGKGVYHSAKVILEDELPSSILLHDGWLYLSGRGTVRRFKQSKPGGAYDVRQVIAQGFCGFHHHQVSGMTLGNDGWLYITSGDDDNFVEGSDGSRANVLRTGAVFRCRPDGSKLHASARGFRNPYRDVAFDAGYNLFHVDNDNEDGSKFMGCRLMHVPEGSDFGWRLYQGARCCKPDAVRGAAFGELPGKVPPLLKTGRGAPAGLLIYNDTRFPKPYRGLLLYPDVLRKLIRAYKVKPRGAGFVVTEEFELMSSSDPLFRPCQMVLGPDGAIYVVDWRTDSGGAGRLWGDGKHGRIYRLSWAGTKVLPALALRGMESWARFARMTDAKLIEALSAEDFSDRERARKELARRGAKNRTALLALLGDSEAALEGRIAALGALQSMWHADVQKAFLRALREEGDLGRLAADGLRLNARRGDKAVHNALLRSLTTEDLAFRRAVAMAMGHVAGPGAADTLATTLSFDDSRDVYLRDGIVRALEALGKPGIDALLNLADSGVQKDIDRVAQTFTALRTRSGYNALPTLLKHPHLSDTQRAALVRSASNYLLDPPVSLEPLAAYLAGRKKEVVAVKLAALEVMALRGVRQGEKCGAWKVAMLRDPDARVRRSALAAIGKTGPASAGPRLGKMLAASRSPAEQVALLHVLRALKEPTATGAVKKVLAGAGETAEGEPVRREAFRTLAVLDPGAAASAARRYLGSKDAALQAEAVSVLGTTAEGARLVARQFLAGKLPRRLLPEVSEALRKHAGRDAEAARQLTRVMKHGLLIRNTPSEVARVRKLVAARGNALRGRSVYLNGKTVACINCHKLEGIGGNVGPDLTGLSGSMTLDKLLEALIEPSKEIKEGFQTFQATTKKGQVYQGLKIVQNAREVVLREASGKDVRLARKDLEELVALKTSLMPDNVLSQLRYAEFIDLVAFLTDKKAQQSLRGLALDFWVVGPFGAEFKKAYPPEGKIDLTATYPGGKKWRAVQAEPTGFLNLRAVFNKENISAYALTHVHSPRVQKVDVLLGSDDTVRLWVNGKLVHEHDKPRSARPDEDRVRVKLKKGWNAVLARVANLTHEHGLYLRFAGDGLRVTRSPEGK